MKKLGIVFLTGLAAIFVSCTKTDRAEPVTTREVIAPPTTADTTTTTTTDTTVVDDTRTTDVARGTSSGNAPARPLGDATTPTEIERQPANRELTPPRTLPGDPSVHGSSDAGTRHGQTEKTK